MTRAYEIANEQNQIVIRFDNRLVDNDTLSKLLDYIELEVIRGRSELDEEQASELADEIDRDVWDQVKHKYMEK